MSDVFNGLTHTMTAVASTLAELLQAVLAYLVAVWRWIDKNLLSIDGDMLTAAPPPLFLLGFASLGTHFSASSAPSSRSSAKCRSRLCSSHGQRLSTPGILLSLRS